MRLGILSDVHEDLLALVKALELFSQRGCDEIVFLGDVTGFNIMNYKYHHLRNAHECLHLIRRHCKYVIAGNHDLHHVKRLPSHSNGFDYPENWYNLDFDEKKEIGEGKVFLYDDYELSPLLRKEDIAFLKSAPEYIIQEYDGIPVLFSHFAYPDLTGSRSYYPRELTEGYPHLSFVQDQGCMIGITGHYHYPGLGLCSLKEWKRLGFGSYQLQHGLQWIYGPCAARGFTRTGEARPNGVMILDTQTLQIDVIPLGHGLTLRS